ncbi:MAG: hypothetical protein DRG78_00630 [Epsilonproteobacteria bacterium]|nr:MAG: hypothetical protein DRG78_00630 [Campylobacterota bacterium]
MVDNISEQIISDYQSGIIKSEVRLILTIGRMCMYDINEIYQILKVLGFNIKTISNIVDSYMILSKGTKIDEQIKRLIEDNEFIDNNSNILLDLAKIYFYCDYITLENNQIIIKKDIVADESESDTLNINVNKAIQMTLQKIKYNKIDATSISKLQELSEYPKYKKLNEILMKAIEYDNKIKALSDDACQMSLDELEDFLN